eukprot:Pgem_evm2s19830
MNVKNGRKNFPCQLLKNSLNSEGRGGFSSATANFKKVDLLATTWNDRCCKQFISSCPSAKKDDEGRVIRNGTVIPRPKVACEYFNGLLGMIETNAFLAYTYFNTTKEKKEMKHWVFREKLAMELINNPYHTEYLEMFHDQQLSTGTKVQLSAELNEHVLASHESVVCGKEKRRPRFRCVSCRSKGKQKKVFTYCSAPTCGPNIALCSGTWFTLRQRNLKLDVNHKHQTLTNIL